MADQLYRQEFMDIYKSAPNYGQLDNPTLQGEKVNLQCGDKMTVQIKLDGNKIVDAKFFGISCAVSKVSGSVFTDYIKGKTLEEVRNLTEKDLLDLIGFDLTPSRQQCALLCYYALKEALQNYEKN